MIRNVAAALRKGGSLYRGGTLVVAVSGGADSVSLLLAMVGLAPRMGFAVVVAHLDHGIRGAESVADARFVRALCERLGVRCVVGRADVPGLAAGRRWSLEQAARFARYAFLARTARRVGARAVAVAHTADDQVETVLLKLLRGGGQGALAGMAETVRINGVTIIRPLLGIRRAAVRRFLAKSGQSWREDASNQDTALLRNRVRHELLPLLRDRFCGGLDSVLLRTADIVREEDEWLSGQAEAAAGRCVTGRSGVRLETASFCGLSCALRRRVLRIWLARCGFPAEKMDFDVVDRLDRVLARGLKRKGGEVGAGFALQIESGFARLVRKGGARVAGAVCPGAPFRARIAVPGTTCMDEAGLKVTVTVGSGIVRDRTVVPGSLPATASLSYAVWRNRAIYVRSRRPGDRIRPLGGAGTRKLQDVFVDLKVPAARRESVPVVECGGEIAWVPGYRISRDWALGSQADKALLVRIESLG